MFSVQISNNYIFCFSDEPVVSLVMFINEGDNRFDAIKLVNYLDTWKKITTVSIFLS